MDVYRAIQISFPAALALAVAEQPTLFSKEVLAPPAPRALPPEEVARRTVALATERASELPRCGSCGAPSFVPRDRFLCDACEVAA